MLQRSLPGSCDIGKITRHQLQLEKEEKEKENKDFEFEPCAEMLRSDKQYSALRNN